MCDGNAGYDLFISTERISTEGRAFVVEKEVLDEGQLRPPRLTDLKGCRFCHGDEHEQCRPLSVEAPELHRTECIRVVEYLGEAGDVPRFA